MPRKTSATRRAPAVLGAALTAATALLTTLALFSPDGRWTFVPVDLADGTEPPTGVHGAHVTVTLAPEHGPRHRVGSYPTDSAGTALVPLGRGFRGVAYVDWPGDRTRLPAHGVIVQPGPGPAYAAPRAVTFGRVLACSYDPATGASHVRYTVVTHGGRYLDITNEIATGPLPVAGGDHTIELENDLGLYFKDTTPGAATAFTPYYSLALAEYRTPVVLSRSHVLEGQLPDEPVHCTP